MFTNRTDVLAAVLKTAPIIMTTIMTTIAALLLTILVASHVYADTKYENNNENNNENNHNNIARLRAAFVYNISKFVTWPDAYFPTLNSPLKLCILTKDYVPQFIELRSKKTQGKSIDVRVFKTKQQLALNTAEQSACHILFISNNEESDLSQSEIISLQKSTLLIGKNRQFLENGGMLALIRVESKIKIFINPKAIGQSQLKLESRLRSLAQTL